MATFHYRALQPDGSIAEGQLDAGGRQEAFRQMEGRGLRPIQLAERNGPNGAAIGAVRPASQKSAQEGPKNGAILSSLKLSLGSGTKISARMLENFTRLLSSLLAAGVP